MREFCGILREIDLAVRVESSLRRALSDCALELLPSFAEEFCSRKLQNSLCLVSPVGKVHFALHCGRNCIRRRSRSAPEYFGISNGKSRVFDIPSDIPSQEGRELSFVSAPRETDPMPVW